MFKNNIISISGMPVAGKSTTVSKMIQELKESGYNENNIHLISTGSKFRKYFEAISEVIRRSSSIQDLNLDIEDEDIKQLFQLPEFRDNLVQTIMELRRKGLNLNAFSIEEANNKEELSSIRKIVDTYIDSEIEKIGIEINSEERPNEIWIIDSRLAFNNIPSSFAVRLTIDEDVAANRLFLDSTRGKEDKYKSVEEAKKAMNARKNGEVIRYKRRYNVDLNDENNYDLIIDTSYSNVEDIADVILMCNKKYHNNLPFTKKWASPKVFLPLQTERETLGKGSVMDIKEMVKSIEINGYYPEANIDVMECDGKYYIYEGHHRNFGLALAKKTLVPYTIIARDDERPYNIGATVRQRVQSLSVANLAGHEWMIDDDFTYKEIYPDLYEKDIEDR